MTPHWRRPLQAATTLGVMVVLGLVAAAYFSPDTVVDLANKVWSCF